jgi:hypothetical protein
MAIELDFIGIGSGKCGSTWLYQNLVKHPEICACNLKELNYFSDLYESRSPAWYESQFAGCAKGQKRGEFSVTYISHPQAAERIQRHLPDVRLMAIVRNPVKRAYSNYLHSIRKGDIAADLAFADYIQDERRLAPGRYADHLQTFTQRFAPGQIRVIITEEFSADPLAGYRSLYRFLDVKDPDFVPPGYDKRSNEAKSYRFLRLENLLVRSYRGLSRRGYTRLVKRIVESGFADRIRMLNRDQRPLPSFDETSRERLQAYYRPYNQRLEDLLGRDLSVWEA